MHGFNGMFYLQFSRWCFSHADLYVIQYADTYTAKVEVQIFTAASRWQTTSLATFTIMDTVPPGAVSFLVDPTWGDIWALRCVARVATCVVLRCEECAAPLAPAGLLR